MASLYQSLAIMEAFLVIKTGGQDMNNFAVHVIGYIHRVQVAAP